MFTDFRMKERKRERERERNTDVREKHPSVAFHTHPNCNLGLCPDPGRNPQPFSVQVDTPADWATLPGPKREIF